MESEILELETSIGRRTSLTILETLHHALLKKFSKNLHKCVSNLSSHVNVSWLKNLFLF